MLPQGNQLWGKMQGLKKRIVKAQELLQTIEKSRIEVKAKTAAAQATRTQAETASNTNSWGNATNYTGIGNSADPLMAKFRQWEADEELESLKRNLGK